jgi:hypothetical protein
MNVPLFLSSATLTLVVMNCGGSTSIGEGAGNETGGGGGATAGTKSSVITGGKASAGGAAATGATGGRDATAATGGTDDTGEGDAELPCDLLQKAGLPCTAAHSTVRLLTSGHIGSLYRVQRADGQFLDIGAVGGYADADAQTRFCANSRCVIETVYDQSPNGNHLTVAIAGSAKPTPDEPVDAAALPVSIAGREVYGMLLRPGEGYRKRFGVGMPLGDAPQTIYMVSSQHDLINGCCFDYGNASTSANDDGNGTVEAVYLGMGVIWGTGVGPGPWVMGDLENGLYPGWENGGSVGISTNTSLTHDFVTAVLVGDLANKNGGKGRFALYGGDAASGRLQTMYDGVRPEKPGYVPMQKGGSVILGVAADNSSSGGGRFYEGVIAQGAATKATVDALQAAIVAADYGN